MALPPRVLTRRAAAVAAVLCCVIAGGCEKKPPATSSTPVDSLSPNLTDRDQRDSARVAQLLFAYYDFTLRRDTASVRRLFYPESILVATPDGGVEVEGQGSELLRQIAAGPGQASRIRRLLLLRRASRDLLEQTYREIWVARFVPERADSAEVEMHVHAIEPLGQDTRWLGRLGNR